MINVLGITTHQSTIVPARHTSLGEAGERGSAHSRKARCKASWLFSFVKYHG